MSDVPRDTTSGAVAGHTGDGHVTEEIPRLLAGEADRTTVRGVGAHLRGCEDCRADLVDAVTAHATLRSAARHAPDVATGGRLPAPADALAPTPGGADVATRLDDAAAAARPGRPVDLEAVFAQIRREAAATTPAAPTGTVGGTAAAPGVDELAERRRRRVRRGLTAAAAVVVLGGGTAVAVTQLGGQDGRTIPVSAFGAGTVDASARTGDGWVRLDASRLPSLPPDKYYEVWLINSSATGLMALGSLGGDRTGTFTVPATVMRTYSTLQVTVQDNNGNPAPSSVSVLRAHL